MPTVHKVAMFKRQEDGTYRARPALVVAEVGDTIRFLNFADRVITLSFPNGPFAFSSAVAVAVDGGFEAVVPDNATPGRKVYLGTTSGAGAPDLQGESSPEIIIDRFTAGQPAAKVPAAY